MSTSVSQHTMRTRLCLSFTLGHLLKIFPLITTVPGILRVQQQNEAVPPTESNHTVRTDGSSETSVTIEGDEELSMNKIAYRYARISGHR